MANADEVLAAVNMMLSNMDVMRRQTELHAVLAKSAFDTLTAAGFTEEQAMELIKARGPLLG